MATKAIWDSEKSFWLDGPAFYGAHMVPTAQMVFPGPVGILKGEEILEGLRGAPRWDSVEMEEKTEEQVGDTLALAYRATGIREGSDPYAAFCSSIYVKHDNSWKLISHQQTPVG